VGHATCAGLVFAALNTVAAPGAALAANHGPVPRLSLGCLWAKAPQHVDPILTTTQVTADLGQTVKFGGTAGPVSNFSCTWEGKPLPKVPNPEAPKYTVQLTVNFYYSATKAAATKLYNEIRTGFGASTAVHGIGNAAAYMPGQDVVTTQMIVLEGTYVFVVELGTTEAHSVQDRQLQTVGRQVVSRLAI
jgi:hypothetical protein